MRLIAIFIATLICTMINAQNVSLKIQNDDSYYYPSNLEFEVLDKNESVIFTQDDLEIDKPLILEGDYTINVFTPWADGIDAFKVENKALVALEKNDSKVEISKHSNSWKKNQPKIINKSYTEHDGRFDAVFEFENNIYFQYQDGQVKITQYGKTLKLLGKYIAKTTEGYLKLSYNPENKELWYVFTDTYN